MYGLPVSANAETNTVPMESNEQFEEVEEAITRELMTNLSLAIGGCNGEVWAEVKNEFTLFPSTVWVYVELYSSDTYQEFYSTMTLEKMDSVREF